MLTHSGRRVRSQAVWAFALILGGPVVAQAQQTGLFPLAPIRRERVPCELEDPSYGLYRKQYYGYFPTCWRRFPPGWGCPSPEAPNAAQSFKELKRQPPPDDDRAGEGRGDGAPGMDNPPDGDRNAGPKPEALPPLPRGERSPFDLDSKPEGAPRDDKSKPLGLNPARRTNPGPVAVRPELSPIDGPVSVPAAANAREIPGAGGAGDSLLGLPEPAAPPAVNPALGPGPGAFRGNGLPPGAGAGAPMTMAGPGDPTAPALAQDDSGMPAQAPQRRGVFGNFFTNFRARFR